MTKSFKDISLHELLEICTDESSANHQSAWAEFIHRYKPYIYKVVQNRYLAWGQKSTDITFADIIDDIVNDVFLILFQDGGRALQLFNARNSDKAFRGYLATIANRLTKRKLTKYLIPGAVHDVADTSEQQPGIEKEARWQFFDYIVNRIRKKSGKNQKHTERDILIFNLYLLEEFTREMIEAQPLFRNIGHRVVDNVLMRNKRKLDRDDENILREILDL